MKLSNNIINLRKSFDLTEEEFSKKIGVFREDVVNWENGISEPNIEILKKISCEFHISIDESVGNDKFVKSDRRLFYYGYEYKSKRVFKNIPLVHINVGRGKKARGIIAIGNNAKGLIAIGGKSVGLFSVGGLSLGLFSIGGIGFGLFTVAGIALALLLSIGGISIAPFAIGGIALGFLSLGGISIGFYSVGGYSIGKYISIGGYANGHIAIGHHVNGIITPVNPSSFELKKIILEYYPNTWNFIINFLCSFFS